MSSLSLVVGLGFAALLAAALGPPGLSLAIAAATAAVAACVVAFWCCRAALAAAWDGLGMFGWVGALVSIVLIGKLGFGLLAGFGAGLARGIAGTIFPLL